MQYEFLAPCAQRQERRTPKGTLVANVCGEIERRLGVDTKVSPILCAQCFLNGPGDSFSPQFMASWEHRFAMTLLGHAVLGFYPEEDVLRIIRIAWKKGKLSPQTAVQIAASLDKCVEHGRITKVSATILVETDLKEILNGILGGAVAGQGTPGSRGGTGEAPSD